MLATRNGQAFLDEQMRSLADQTHATMDIWASDDGSTDRTMQILQEWQKRWDKGCFHISQGPKKGFAENFRALITNDKMQPDFIAFCDQDDIWEPHKIECALAWMRQQDEGLPLMFCSRTLNVTETGAREGMSPLFNRKPSFRNALVQSIAGGNTMVLNALAWQRLNEASRRAEFVSHDWWSYLIVSGGGGVVNYCSEPLVRYRQHTGNVVGANTSWKALLTRLRLVWSGRLSRWNDVNLAGLDRNRNILTEDTLEVIERFRHVRHGGFFSRLSGLAKSRIYRQTRRGTVALWLAAAFGRI
nr:glycosyltransferase [Mesorhizobium sp.]